MKRKIKILVANPAGNVTIFVDEPFAQKDYQNVAAQLLAMPELRGEQVAFVKEAADCVADGKMEMCGMEFCGNASRSFGLLLAIRKGIRGKADITVDVSGCRELLTVAVDTETSDTKVQMPVPLAIRPIDLRSVFDNTEFEAGETVRRENLAAVRAVDFGGIIHLILKDIPATEKNFEILRHAMYNWADPPALGVMFCDSKTATLTPVVYVKEVDTTYFEGSCGSGTTACAAAFSMNKPDGTYTYTFPQPAGTITSTVIRKDGQIAQIFIEGPVSLSDAMEVTIDI